MDEHDRQAAYRQAVALFNQRLGVDHMTLHISEEAQKTVRMNLDKETIRLRAMHINDLGKVDEKWQ